MTPLDKEIIRGMADNDMSVLAVAKSLFMHRNTINYHIERVRRETGLNPRNFYDLAELLKRIEAENE